EMKPSLTELKQGSTTTANALDRVAGWRAELGLDRRDLVAIAPPLFLTGMDERWGAVMDAYLRVADLFAQAAQVTGAARDGLIDQAVAAGGVADRAFDAASGVMQFHRKRLGLGTTHNLPNPEATATATAA